MTQTDNAALLRAVLKERGLTQQQAANLAGVDRTKINALARGRAPMGAELAGKIEVGLQLPDGYFSRQTEKPAATPAALAARMDEALVNQRAQWKELERLGGDVRGIATDLTELAKDLASLNAFLRSALEPPDSGRGRRTGGS